MLWKFCDSTVGHCVTVSLCHCVTVQVKSKLEAEAAMEAGRVARVLLLKLFYDDTPNGVLGMLLRLVREYDKTWQPRRWVTVAVCCTTSPTLQ